MAETREQENARKRRERAARKARDPEGFLAKGRAQREKWERDHPGYFREKAMEWYWAHPERAAAKHKAWIAAHAEEWAEYMRGWKADNKENVAVYQKQWEMAHPENVRRNGTKARHKRREADFPYARMDPWPAECQCCYNPIDGALKHRRGTKDPYGETLGHEPPIHWADNHPEYAGEYVIRPEHWRCNARKGTRPDWELPADLFKTTP